MTDKVQKIREEVERLKEWQPIATPSLNKLLSLLDTMQEEPVSEDLEDVADKYSQSIHSDYPNDMFDRGDIYEAVIYGAKWQKGKDEYITDDLGEYISELSKQFPEVSFAKLSRIAVRVAKWKEEQFEKNRLKHCNSITNEQAELEQGFIDQHLDKYRRMPTFLDAIKYGMMLQKEQMKEVLRTEYEKGRHDALEEMKKSKQC